MASCRIVPEDTETESAGKDNFLGWHIFTQNLIQIKSNPPKKWKWTYDCALKGVLYSTGARIDLHFDSDCRNWSFQELEISTLMWSLCLFWILWTLWISKEIEQFYTHFLTKKLVLQLKWRMLISNWKVLFQKDVYIWIWKMEWDLEHDLHYREHAVIIGFGLLDSNRSNKHRSALCDWPLIQIS